jgi:hypothetical protein
MRHAVESGNRKSDRLGDAFDRQVAIDGGRLVTVEFDTGRLESGGREFCGVEEILALNVLLM